MSYTISAEARECAEKLWRDVWERVPHLHGMDAEIKQSMANTAQQLIDRIEQRHKEEVEKLEIEQAKEILKYIEQAEQAEQWHKKAGARVESLRSQLRERDAEVAKWKDGLVSTFSELNQLRAELVTLRNDNERLTRERDQAKREWAEDFEVRTHLLRERDEAIAKADSLQRRIKELEDMQDAWDRVNLPREVPISYTDLLLENARLTQALK